MKLDSSKFTVDESRSNPMVVAMKYADCPINGICVFMVVGFGTVAEQCKYFADEIESAVCTYSSIGDIPDRDT